MECCNVEMRIVDSAEVCTDGQTQLLISYQCPKCGQVKTTTVIKE